MFKQKITRDIVANCMHPDLMQYPIMEQYIDLVYTKLSNQADIYGLESKQKTELILVSRTDTAFQIIFWGAEIVFFRLGEIECMTEPFFKIRALNAIEDYFKRDKKNPTLRFRIAYEETRGSVKMKDSVCRVKLDRWDKWQPLTDAPKDVFEAILYSIEKINDKSDKHLLN